MQSVKVDGKGNDKDSVAGHTIEEALEIIGNGKVQWFAVTASIFCLMVYFVDLLGFGLILPAAECDLQMDTFRKGLLSSAPFLGIAITTHSWGFLADFIGRRRTMYLSLPTCAICSFLAAVMPNFYIILPLRFATGVCQAGAVSAMYPYVAELLKPSTRSKMMVLIAYAIGLGIIYSAGSGWITQKFNLHWTISEYYTLQPWRIQLIIAMLPGLVALMIYYTLPESPKYLLSFGKKEDAMQVLKDIFERNGKNAAYFPVKSLQDFEMVSSSKKTFLIALKAMLHETKVLLQPPCLWPMLGSCFILFVLFTGADGYFIWYPEISRRLKDSGSGATRICDVFTRAANTTHVANEKNWNDCQVHIPDQVYIDSLAIGCFYMLANTIVYICHKKFKLRHVTIAMMVISGVSVFLLPSLTINVAIIFFFMCFVVGNGGGVNNFNVVIVEVFPNYLCGMAVSLGMLSGMIAAFVGTGVLGVLLENYCEVTLYGTGVLILAAIVILFLLPKKILMG